MSAVMQQEMESKRKFVRVTAEVGQPVRVDVNGDDFIDVLNATDISENGIGVTVPHRFENCKIDGEINLILCMPKPINHNIRVKGRIRHISDTHFGIMFQDIAPEDLQRVRKYVQYRLKPRSGTLIGRIFDWFDGDEEK